MGVINYSKVPRKNLQNPEGPAKTYAESQSRGRMDIEKLAKHMAAHNTPFTKGTIKGILEDFVDCTRELILDGWIVDLGNLGTFNVKLQSNGVMESVPDDKTGKKPVFTAADITAVLCSYTPGPGFQNMIEDCEFKQVETLKVQSEHLVEKSKVIADGEYFEKKEEDDVETHE